MCSNTPNPFSFLALAAPPSLGNFPVTSLSNHLQKKIPAEAPWHKLDGLNVRLKCDVTYNTVQGSLSYLMPSAGEEG